MAELVRYNAAAAHKIMFYYLNNNIYMLVGKRGRTNWLWKLPWSKKEKGNLFRLQRTIKFQNKVARMSFPPRHEGFNIP